jgi:hypothetical protein
MNGDCPNVHLTLPEDVDSGPEVEVTCNPDGTASVTIGITVNNTTPNFILCVGRCGPGGVIEQGGGSTGGGPGTVFAFEFVCRYNTPSTPTPFVEILDINLQPTGCPNYQVPVAPIPACPISVCPLVQGVQVEVRECARDPQDGGTLKRRVTFTPSLYLPAGIASHVWMFGDGATVPNSGPPTQTEHLYELAPSIAPQLCISPTSAECQPQCFEIPLSDFAGFRLCECPQILDIGVQVGACETDPADGKLKRNVTFTPALTGPSPSAHNWIFGDGSSDVGAGTPGSVSHLYEQVPAIPPRLCVQATAPCEETCREIPLSAFDQFEPCVGGGGGDGGDNGGGEGGLCFGARAVMTIAAILAIVSVALAACVPPAATPLLWLAVGLGLVTAVAAIVWSIFCPKPCGWGALLAWQVALGVGFILLCFTVCCPTFWLLGVGLVGVGVGLMFTWKNRCNMSNCALLKELVIAISGVVLPLLGWLEVIPVLAACVNPLVTGALSTLAAAIAVAATNCDS